MVRPFGIVATPTQRMIDMAGRLRMAANHCEVALDDLLVREPATQRGGDVSLQCEQQDARCALVEPVNRMNVPADLIT